MGWAARANYRTNNETIKVESVLVWDSRRGPWVRSDRNRRQERRDRAARRRRT
jgi:hypothetical protein